MTAVRKFMFDTVFTPDGKVTHAPKAERLTYKRDEVEEIRKEMFAEGERSAVAEAERRTAAALEAITALLRTFDTVVSSLRTDAVELSLAAARAAADTAINQYPEEALAGLFTECLEALRGAPRIVTTAPPDTLDAVRARLTTLAATAGLDGVISVEAGDGPARIEWRDGAAEINPEDALARAREAAMRWLKAQDDADSQMNLFDAPAGGTGNV